MRDIANASAPWFHLLNEMQFFCSIHKAILVTNNNNLLWIQILSLKKKEKRK